MSTRLTPAEINRVGEALVGGDLVTELEAIVSDRLERVRAYAHSLWDSPSADDRQIAEELERLLEAIP